MIGTIPLHPSDPLGRLEVRRGEYHGDHPQHNGRCILEILDQGRTVFAVHMQSKASLERLAHDLLDLAQQQANVDGRRALLNGTLTP